MTAGSVQMETATADLYRLAIYEILRATQFGPPTSMWPPRQGLDWPIEMKVEKVDLVK